MISMTSPATYEPTFPSAIPARGSYDSHVLPLSTAKQDLKNALIPPYTVGDDGGVDGAPVAKQYMLWFLTGRAGGMDIQRGVLHVRGILEGAV